MKIDVKIKGSENVNWIQLAREWVKWRVLVNTVMNIRAPYKEENFFTN